MLFRAKRGENFYYVVYTIIYYILDVLPYVVLFRAKRGKVFILYILYVFLYVVPFRAKRGETFDYILVYDNA